MTKRITDDLILAKQAKILEELRHLYHELTGVMQNAARWTKVLDKEMPTSPDDLSLRYGLVQDQLAGLQKDITQEMVGIIEKVTEIQYAFYDLQKAKKNIEL